jgi:thiol-disulfide isomerase/thioredoxin
MNMRLLPFIIINVLFTVLHLTIVSVNAAPALMTEMKQVQPASNFTLPDAQGKPVSLSDYQGKYVLVNFWAHWCAPCVKEFPSMQHLYEEVGNDRFEIIAIHAGPFDSGLDSFLKKTGATFPVVEDKDTSLRDWDVPALPMTYLVDPNGNLIYKAIGPREWEPTVMKQFLTP